MNPSNRFIYSHRRLFRADSPSESKACNEYNYSSRVNVFLATYFMVGLIVILIVFICKCFIKSQSSLDHPTTQEPPSNHDVLEVIPVYIYGTSSLPGTLPSCSFEVENCVICLDEYVNGDCLRVLPTCKHMFHKDCIDQWLMVKSFHCPICRDPTIEQDVELARTNCRNSADLSSSIAFSFPAISWRATATL